METFREMLEKCTVSYPFDEIGLHSSLIIDMSYGYEGAVIMLCFGCVTRVRTTTQNTDDNIMDHLLAIPNLFYPHLRHETERVK